MTKRMTIAKLPKAEIIKRLQDQGRENEALEKENAVLRERLLGESQAYESRIKTLLGQQKLADARNDALERHLDTARVMVESIIQTWDDLT